MRNMLDASKLADEDTERLVLATIMQHPELTDAGLDHGHFCAKKHQALFDAVRALFAAGQPVSPVSLFAWLKAHVQPNPWAGFSDLVEFQVNFANPTKQITHYIQVLKGLALRRTIQRAAFQLLQDVYQAEDGTVPLKSFEAEVYRYLDDTPQKFHDMQEVTMETLEQVDAAYKGQAEIGIPTSLPSVNRLIGGWMKSDLVIVGGRPGMGKSAFMVQSMVEAGKRGYGVAVVSLEMSQFDLALRMFGVTDAVLAPHALRRGQLTSDGWRRMTEAASSLQSLPIYIADLVDCTIQTIRIKLKALMAERSISVLFLDYVQMLSPDKQSASRQLEVTEFSRGLKGIAKELNIPVVALASLNRQCEARSDRRPMLSDLRESGNLESDADVVMFFYRDEVYDDESADKGKAEILVRKNRHGAVGDVVVGFDGPSMTFYELTGFKSSTYSGVVPYPLTSQEGA